MAKRAYCKQYAVVLLPIFAYVKPYEEERREKFFSHCVAVCSVHPSVPCACEGEAATCAGQRRWPAPSECLVFARCLAVGEAGR